MDVVLKIEKKNVEKVKDKLLKDENVSKASVVFREGSSIGTDFNGYYCYISGTDELCKKAVELAKELGEKAGKKESKNIISKIKEDEDKAVEGFGSIFR